MSEQKILSEEEYLAALSALQRGDGTLSVLQDRAELLRLLREVKGALNEAAAGSDVQVEAAVLCAEMDNIPAIKAALPVDAAPAPE